ncbi:MAG: hypothetical protein JW785_03785 [Acidimicrobiia bacterium]|nr:hypothetical protein [Acidimicrobiia bacterium]
MLVAVGGLLLASAAHSEPPVELAAAVPDDVVAGMGSMGCQLSPAPADASLLAKVGPIEALAAAQAELASKPKPNSAAFALYSDTVTRAVNEQGDPYGPLLGPQKLLVYVFVFDGLELPPSGPYGRTGTTILHHEIVMLIDASTGEWVLDGTFR